LVQPVESVEVAMKTESPTFREGWEVGYSGSGCFGRSFVDRPPTESDIVGLIVNLVQINEEGWLTDELVRRDAGLIAGWLCRFFETGKELKGGD